MNERKFWKALVSAFGGTGSTINEQDTRNSLVSAVEAFAASGGGIADKTEVAALTAIATADATDPATTMALANINKAKINSIIAALKA